MSCQAGRGVNRASPPPEACLSSPPGAGVRRMSVEGDGRMGGPSEWYRARWRGGERGRSLAPPRGGGAPEALAGAPGRSCEPLRSNAGVARRASSSSSPESSDRGTPTVRPAAGEREASVVEPKQEGQARGD